MNLSTYRAEQGVATSLDKGLLAFVVHLGMLEIFIGQEGRSPVLVGLKQAAWAKDGMVEPLLVRAIDYKHMVQQVLSSADTERASVSHVTEIFQIGIDIIRDLEAAASYRILSPGPRNKPGPDGAVDEDLNSFNHLLGRKSDASDAIAKAVLKSAFADKDTKMWIMDKCMAVSQASGFGMAMYQQGWFETDGAKD
ncbi:hypothetical protein CCUS01_12294 [Colletotrichum cuscutae]|uniref:Uncharacterized protein n=1 Tax=Colletotrichum cuscutae TaxID=1209917 RepID=A0AAI9TVI7_9PEZI|nr:hypothetical protein CCUS01_12294 [Colletotrichum cuscutae]